MHVFVTGATGFVGSAVVQELLKAGHKVLGLVRSDESEQKLKATGAEPLRGDLEDLESLRKGAADTDAIIHTGFVHDFSRFAEVCAIDHRAIETMGAVLAGSHKPFIITSGTALVSPGKLATEDIIPTPGTHHHPRVASELAASAAAEKGVCVSVVRLSPSVHSNNDKHGFVPMLINMARQKGVSAYVGDGANRWTGVHQLDAAHLYLMALDNKVPGARFHAAEDEGVPFKSIAEAIGEQLNIPVVSKTHEEAAEHFGWFNAFVSLDAPVSSKLTRQQLGWQPTQVTLLEDFKKGSYASV